ncbi:hypothetical protein R3P38DRAFT_2780894 [Favolaschia claudopus]|uniref:Uncharacterized protein n=1 Tax=Favolaschia claudopus TaxID=2862362 RepID=A0AAW0B8B5_9AGAR
MKSRVAAVVNKDLPKSSRSAFVCNRLRRGAAAAAKSARDEATTKEETTIPEAKTCGRSERRADTRSTSPQRTDVDAVEEGAFEFDGLIDANDWRQSPKQLVVLRRRPLGKSSNEAKISRRSRRSLTGSRKRAQERGPPCNLQTRCQGRGSEKARAQGRNLVVGNTGNVDDVERGDRNEERDEIREVDSDEGRDGEAAKGEEENRHSYVPINLRPLSPPCRARVIQGLEGAGARWRWRERKVTVTNVTATSRRYWRRWREKDDRPTFHARIVSSSIPKKGRKVDTFEVAHNNDSLNSDAAPCRFHTETAEEKTSLTDESVLRLPISTRELSKGVLTRAFSAARQVALKNSSLRPDSLALIVDADVTPEQRIGSRSRRLRGWRMVFDPGRERGKEMKEEIFMSIVPSVELDTVEALERVHACTSAERGETLKHPVFKLVGLVESSFIESCQARVAGTFSSHRSDPSSRKSNETGSELQRPLKALRAGQAKESGMESRGCETLSNSTPFPVYHLAIGNDETEKQTTGVDGTSRVQEGAKERMRPTKAEGVVGETESVDESSSFCADLEVECRVSPPREEWGEIPTSRRRRWRHVTSLYGRRLPPTPRPSSEKGGGELDFMPMTKGRLLAEERGKDWSSSRKRSESLDEDKTSAEHSPPLSPYGEGQCDPPQGSCNLGGTGSLYTHAQASRGT